MDNSDINDQKFVQHQRRPSVLIAAFIITLVVIPSFQSLFGYRLFKIVVGSFILWWVFINLETQYLWERVFHPRLSLLGIYALWIFIALFYTLVDPFNQYRNVIMGDTTKVFFSFSQISILYIIGLVYSSEPDTKLFKRLIEFTFVALGLNAFLALPSLLNEELLVRAYINTYQSAEIAKQSLSSYALGGLGYYGVLAIVAPIFLATIISAKGFKRFVYLIFFVGIGLNVFLSSLLAIFTIFIFSTAIYLFNIMVKRKGPASLRFGIVVLAIFAVILGFQLREAHSARYSLARIAILFTPDDSGIVVEGDTTEKRMMLYERSFRTFLKYPIVGVGMSSVLSYSYGIRESGIGGHSGILDGLAMYGVLFVIYLMFLRMGYRYLRSVTKGDNYDLWMLSYRVSFLAYAILILIDPLLYNSAITGVFFLFTMASATPAKSLLIVNSDLAHA